MQIIQLYIEGQRVDMFKDESISITQSIQNVKDIAKVFTDFSKTFSVPASKINNKIFKHYYNFDIQNGFDARKKKDATIELNNITFREGKIKLEGVDLKNNLPHTYRITFFGNTVSLKDLLGEDKLQSLSDLDSLSVVYDVNGIRGGLQLDPATNDVIVPLITHTQRLIYDSTNSNHVDDNIADTGGSQNIHGVNYTQLKYALRIHKIVEAIESKYSITFSDDFFVDTNAPYYDLFMWLHRKKGDVQNLSGVNQSLVNGWEVDLEPVLDTETQMINSSTLRVFGVPQFYDVFNLILQKSVGLSYKAIVYKDGVEVYKSASTSGNLTISKSDINLEEADYTVYIEADGNLTFSDIYWDISYTEPFSNTETITYNTGTYNYVSAFDFIITQQIPEMKVIDFLTGLFKMFNLTAYIENDIVVVKTLDSFYSSGNSYDISKYVEVDKSAVNVALPYREINFSYEDTGTFLAKQHTQLAGKEWAKLNYNGGEGKLDGGLYSVKLPFGHLKNERLIDGFDGSATGIMYGYYVDDNQESYIGKPLLFYPIKQTGQETISFVNSSSSKTILLTYNIPSNSLALARSTSKVNINFNNELNEYTGTNDFTDTLFEVYYKNYITNVFNSTNRLTKVSAYLPLRILYNYTLADRFVINGRSYKINSITSNLETGKSELELLNDL